MKKELIPYSYLFLYCKGWLRFLDSKGFVDDMRRIIELDNYIANPNPVGQVLNGFNQIKEYLENHGVKLSPEWTNFGYFYERAQWRAWDEKPVKYDNDTKEVTALEIGMMREVYGVIQCMKTRDFIAVKNIDYKKWKVRLASWRHGDTYKTMQWRFNKMFKDMLIDKSYEEPWNIQHGYKI